MDSEDNSDSSKEGDDDDNANPERSGGGTQDESYLQMCEASAKILQVLSGYMGGLQSAQIIELESVSDETDDNMSYSSSDASSHTSQDEESRPDSECVIWAEPLLTCTLPPSNPDPCFGIRRLLPGAAPDDIRRLPPGVKPSDIRRTDQRPAFSRAVPPGSALGPRPTNDAAATARMTLMSASARALQIAAQKSAPQNLAEAQATQLSRQSALTSALRGGGDSTTGAVRIGASRATTSTTTTGNSRTQATTSTTTTSSSQASDTDAEFRAAMAQITSASETIRQAHSLLNSMGLGHYSYRRLCSAAQSNNNSNPTASTGTENTAEGSCDVVNVAQCSEDLVTRSRENGQQTNGSDRRSTQTNYSNSSQTSSTDSATETDRNFPPLTVVRPITNSAQTVNNTNTVPTNNTDTSRPSLVSSLPRRPLYRSEAVTAGSYTANARTATGTPLTRPSFFSRVLARQDRNASAANFSPGVASSSTRWSSHLHNRPQYQPASTLRSPAASEVPHADNTNSTVPASRNQLATSLMSSLANTRMFYGNDFTRAPNTDSRKNAQGNQTSVSNRTTTVKPLANDKDEVSNKQTARKPRHTITIEDLKRALDIAMRSIKQSDGWMRDSPDANSESSGQASPYEVVEIDSDPSSQTRVNAFQQTNDSSGQVTPSTARQKVADRSGSLTPVTPIHQTNEGSGHITPVTAMPQPSDHTTLEPDQLMNGEGTTITAATPRPQSNEGSHRIATATPIQPMDDSDGQVNPITEQLEGIERESNDKEGKDLNSMTSPIPGAKRVTFIDDPTLCPNDTPILKNEDENSVSVVPSSSGDINKDSGVSEEMEPTKDSLHAQSVPDLCNLEGTLDKQNKCPALQLCRDNQIQNYTDDTDLLLEKSASSVNVSTVVKDGASETVYISNLNNSDNVEPCVTETGISSASDIVPLDQYNICENVQPLSVLKADFVTICHTGLDCEPKAISNLLESEWQRKLLENEHSNCSDETFQYGLPSQLCKDTKKIAFPADTRSDIDATAKEKEEGKMIVSQIIAEATSIIENSERLSNCADSVCGGQNMNTGYTLGCEMKSACDTRTSSRLSFQSQLNKEKDRLKCSIFEKEINAKLVEIIDCDKMEAVSSRCASIADIENNENLVNGPIQSPKVGENVDDIPTLKSPDCQQENSIGEFKKVEVKSEVEPTGTECDNTDIDSLTNVECTSSQIDHFVEVVDVLEDLIGGDSSAGTARPDSKTESNAEAEDSDKEDEGYLPQLSELADEFQENEEPACPVPSPALTSERSGHSVKCCAVIGSSALSEGTTPTLCDTDDSLKAFLGDTSYDPTLTLLAGVCVTKDGDPLSRGDTTQATRGDETNRSSPTTTKASISGTSLGPRFKCNQADAWDKIRKYDKFGWPGSGERRRPGTSQGFVSSYRARMSRPVSRIGSARVSRSSDKVDLWFREIEKELVFKTCQNTKTGSTRKLAESSPPRCKKQTKEEESATKPPAKSESSLSVIDLQPEEPPDTVELPEPALPGNLEVRVGAWGKNSQKDVLEVIEPEDKLIERTLVKTVGGSDDESWDGEGSGYSKSPPGHTPKPRGRVRRLRFRRRRRRRRSRHEGWWSRGVRWMKARVKLVFAPCLK